MARLKSRKEYFSARTTGLAKKVGTAIAALGTAITTYCVTNEAPEWLTLGSVALTWIGPIITGFFTTDTYYEDATEIKEQTDESLVK